MIIVILVFILFMGALGGLLHFASAQSSADEYDVEKQTKGIEMILQCIWIIMDCLISKGM